MYTRTYFDKCATIVRGSSLNTGMNPVSELLWGRNLSRTLIYFDHSQLKKLVDEKICPDLNKFHHVLKMTNASSLDMSELYKVYSSQVDGDDKRRTSSFDLIYFLLPELWDNGKGFDYSKNYFIQHYYDKKSYDYTLYKLEDGVNWFEARNGCTWKEDIDYVKTNDELFDFYIKTDKKYIGGTGATVTFNYYCTCNDNFANQNIEFEVLNNSVLNPVSAGTQIFFAKNGQICYTDEHKAKYASYIKTAVDFPANNLDDFKKYSFRIKLTIGDKTFKSNPYSIVQQPKDDKSYPQTKDGIYDTNTLRKELEKYHAGYDSIIIGVQHFDIGNENVNIDITDTVNKFITGKLNNCGIGIAYAPNIEESTSLYENYTGLLTNKTNSFYEPYLETIYDEVIEDDRANFILGKNNKLYLYSNIGGKLENLDVLPTCTVNDIQYDVKQASKGIYYIDICLPFSAYTSPTMLYDVWDGLVYQGQNLNPVELEFTTQSPFGYFSIGNQLPEKNEFTPTAYGIKFNEQIQRGDLRKINFLIKKNFTKNTAVNIDSIEARLYVMDGDIQVDVIPYTKVNRSFNENYLMLDTNILIPNTYYIDIKVNFGMECLEHQEVLKFKILENTKGLFE